MVPRSFTIRTDISNRCELSTGQTVWVQRIGRKYFAVKCAPVWCEAPENVGPVDKASAVDTVADWIQQDVCEIGD
jgi:hypothetical protein